MKELLAVLKNLVSQNIESVKEITDLDGLENMFVFEMENGKKYALSLLELD